MKFKSNEEPLNNYEKSQKWIFLYFENVLKNGLEWSKKGQIWQNVVFSGQNWTVDYKKGLELSKSSEMRFEKDEITK